MSGWVAPTNWYWSVQDSSPGTQVWQSSSASFVVLANADYVAFLAASNLATVIDTFVDLVQVIDNYNKLAIVQEQGQNVVNSAVDVVLTTPLLSFQRVTMTAAGKKVQMPNAASINGAIIGVPVLFLNEGANSFTVTNSNGGNIITLGPNDLGFVTLINNNVVTNPGGIWRGPSMVAISDPSAANHLLASSGGIWNEQPVGGDVSLNAGGGINTFTLASTITAGGPMGDASHVAQITYDAKGRLTAVTSVAIAISDAAITYSNESANKIFAGPTSGGAAAPTFRSLVGADLPNPSASTLGGLFSHASVASQFLVSLDTSGSLTGAQPAFSNLTGVASIAQGGTNQTALPAAGQVLIAQSSSAFAPMSLSGGATLGAGGTVTLGTPGTAVLGGLFSFASVSNQFLTSLATSGSLAAAQPAFSNISGTVAAAQLSTATTQAAGDNTAKIATDAFVTTAVNNAISGVNPAVSVAAATTGNLPNTPAYNNGASGIGAFITSGTNSVLVLDGYTPLLNDRVLVKNETGGLGASRNGVYNVTQLGVAGVLPWILTRALDYDQPSDINSTGAIPVVNGTVNATTSWVITSTVNTVGTDALTYTQFTLAPASVLQVANNLSDVASAATSRTNLGLGTMATVNSPAPVANGGTGNTGGAWTSWTPTVTAQTPGVTPPTFTVNSATYEQIGKKVFFRFDISVTAAGTGTGFIQVTLPVNGVAGADQAAGGFDFNSVKMIGWALRASATGNVLLFYYDGTSPINTSARLVAAGVYESA